MILMNAFYNEQDLGDILNYKDKIMAITTDDIKRVAKKYLSDNYLALYIEKESLTRTPRLRSRVTNP